MTISLNLLVLKAKNPERLVSFYTHFGLDFTQEKHGAGPLHHACSLGDSVFEIYPCAADESSSPSTRIGFKVPSISSILGELGPDVQVVNSPKETKWGRRCVLADPEGHRVELIEGT